MAISPSLVVTLRNWRFVKGKSTVKTTESLRVMGSAALAGRDGLVGEVGDRISRFLRDVWPSDTAKHAARTFNCSPRTSEGWLAGQIPMNRHLLLMMVAWGPRFVAFVFEPAIGVAIAAQSIDREFQDLKAQMARLEGALNAAIEKENRPVAVRGGGAAHEARQSLG